MPVSTLAAVSEAARAPLDEHASLARGLELIVLAWPEYAEALAPLQQVAAGGCSREEFTEALLRQRPALASARGAAAALDALAIYTSRAGAMGFGSPAVPPGDTTLDPEDVYARRRQSPDR